MTTTNLPATIAESALVIPENEWGDVDSGWSGQAPPSAAPVVPLLKFNAKASYGFTDELTGQTIGEGQSVDVVWLAWKESRAYWEGDYDPKAADKSPDCRSDNMVVPDDLSRNKQSATCAACPHSQWVDNKPPECGVRVNAMIYLPDQERITRTSFAGLGLKHVQRYLGGFETRLPRRPPMAFLTRIEVVGEETPNGKFLVPHFSVAGDITREAAVPLIQLRDELRKQWEALAAEDASARDTAPNPDPFASDPNIIEGEVLPDEEPF